MAEEQKVGLNELGEWVKSETVAIVETLREEAKKLLEDLQDKFDDLSKSNEKLSDDAEKELAKGSRKTYRRAKLLQKITGNFADLLDDLSIPEKISGETLNQFSEGLEKTVETITQERMKYFRAISPYFIMARRRFDVSLKRASDAFQNFQAFLSDEYVKAESAEGVASQIEELTQSLIQLKEAEKTRQTRKHRKEILKKKIAENEQEMKAIQSTDEVIELVQINTRIENLEKNVKHDLRHLQKPLLKFQTLANNPGYNLSSDATNKLNEYLDDSFRAFATEEEGYPLLRDILRKIYDAIQKGKLKLKPSRMRKAKDQIDDILNKTALLSLHQNCREAFSKKYELSTSDAISETRSKRAELQKNLKDLQRKKRILEKREAVQEKENQRLLERVEGQKRELKEVVQELVDKNIQIILD
jgi:hypothetical protein